MLELEAAEAAADGGLRYLAERLRQVLDGVRSAVASHLLELRRKGPVSDRSGDPRLPPRADRSRGAVMPAFLSDLARACRALARTPGFTSLAVLDLSLGVGAVAAIFLVFHGVLLTPLPYEEPGQLVRIFHRDLENPDDDRGSVSFGNFADWSEQATALESIAATFVQEGVVQGPGEPERVLLSASLGSPFEVLRSRPIAGRLYSRADDRPDAPAVVVLSKRLAESRFGSAEAAVGRELTLNGRSRTVLGVVEDGLDYPERDVAIWLPSRFGEEMRANRTEYWLQVIGRIGEGSTLETVRSQMGTIAARLRIEHPQANGNVEIAVVPLAEVVVGQVRTRLGLLQGAALLVLLVACANLVHLLLARRESRRTELAVRAALGAGSLQLLREQLAVALVLGLAGGLLGVAVGAISLEALLTSMPVDLPRLDEVRLSVTAVGAVLGLVLTAALGCGVLPVLGDLRPRRRTSDALRQRGGAAHTGGKLVVAETALAVVLLIGAGLMLRSFLELQRVDPGFRPERLLGFELSAPLSAGEEGGNVAFHDELSRRLQGLPGVESVGRITNLPGTGRGTGAWLNIVGRPLPPDQTPPIAVWRVASPSYFETAGVALRSGRLLGDGDGRDGTAAVLINETAARTFWSDESPLGQEVSLGPDGGWLPPSQVVGVVADVMHRGLGTEPLPVVYMPHALMPQFGDFAIVVRTEGEPEHLAAAVRSTVRDLDPTVAVANLAPVTVRLAESVAPTRSLWLLLTVFAALALLLAAVGIFGTLSHSVRRRQRELGIRLALGASRTRLRRLVVGQALSWVAVGLGLGLVASIALGDLLEALLYGVRPVDVSTYCGVSALLVVIAFLAAFVPAQRAARADPADLLDAE
ncbi:MAG: permease [Acidobacteria bacterium]|nr:MAG: permease [Acidobacteriota bacterium]